MSITTIPAIKKAGESLYKMLAFGYRANTNQKIERATFLVEVICPVKRWAHSNDIIAIVQVAHKDMHEIINSGDTVTEEIFDIREQLAGWMASNGISVPRYS